MFVLPTLFVFFAYVHDAWSASDCKLKIHPSVFYVCPGSDNAPRLCSSQEPDGTIVTPECNVPYYSLNPLPLMKCINGSWDNIAICNDECGIILSDGNRELSASDKRPVTKGKLPWHASIYKKTTTPYKQICGGSLITPNVVISAAHCFWSGRAVEKPLASDYAVAVGKQYRQWNDERDTDAQKSDVQAVRLPSQYFGMFTNYQEDIAVVFVATAFKFNYHVLPVCLNFDVSSKQNLDGSIGKMSSWDSGAESAALQVVELSYIDVGQCFATSPANFREYLTIDKICAGYTYNDNEFFQGSSGGGLVFPVMMGGREQYFIRGVASILPTDENYNPQMKIATFTDVLYHEKMITTN